MLTSGSRRITTHTALGVVLAVALMGCGGGDAFEDPGGGDTGDLDNLPPGVGEVLDGILDEEGVDIDIDSDGGMTMSDETGEFTMGTDLDPPDWLPGGFPLPAKISIQGYGIEDGTSTILALHDDTIDVVAERDRLASWFASNGYGVLNDDATNGQLSMVAANDDGQVIDIRVRSGSYTLEISHRDVTFDRQDGAERVEGPGTATVVVAGDAFEVEGTCAIQGAEYSFEHYATDGATTVTLWVSAVLDPPSGSGFVMQLGKSSVAQYAVNFPMGNGNEPDVSTSTNEFAVSGELLDMTGSGTVQGSIAVTCAG